MAKFAVHLKETIVRSVVAYVEAPDYEAAENLALELAGRGDEFLAWDYEETVDGPEITYGASLMGPFQIAQNERLGMPFHNATELLK